MQNSKIEWCYHTFNPWEGCTKVSPGCAHCYAEARNQRFAAGANWGEGAPRRRTSAANWKQPLAWNRAAGLLARDAEACGRDPGPRPRVFCASLADWLDPEVDPFWRADLLDLIFKTPHLDWLLLTKRPEHWRHRITEAICCMTFEYEVALEEWTRAWLAGDYPANVWIGTTVEDQMRADERIPQLIAIPARVRFLSCEPLLGSVDLGLFGICLKDWRQGFTPIHSHIDWVICGGESGSSARPMHPDWARSLRDQCAAAGVAFFFKQWGEWLPGCQYREGDKERLHEKSQHSFDLDHHSWWVGKSAAGRVIDGRYHDAFPLSVSSVCSVGISPS